MRRTFTPASTYNLADDDTCAPGFTPIAPDALKLSWRGWYLAPLPGSVAIDAGSNAPCLAADQRGWPRPQDGDGDGSIVCDVGSAELFQHECSAYLPLILKR